MPTVFGEKVKGEIMIIIKKIKESYVLNNSPYGGDIGVDGTLIPASDEAIVFSKRPERIYRIEKNCILSHYVDADGKKVSLAEHRAKRKLCCNEDGEYATLDDEFDWRRFVAKLSPVHDTTEKEVSLDFEIVELPDSDNEFIIPFRLVGLADFKKALYAYKPNAVKMFMGVAGEYGFSGIPHHTGNSKTLGMKYEIPQSNDIEYCKINGIYAFSNITRQLNGIMYGTYEECEMRYNAHITIIGDAFKRQFARIKNMVVEDIGVKDLLDRISSIKSYANGISPKQKSYSEYTNMLRLLNDLEQKIIDRGQ